MARAGVVVGGSVAVAGGTVAAPVGAADDGEAVVVGVRPEYVSLSPAPVAGGLSGRVSVVETNFEGTIRTDNPARQAAADDFGHIVHRFPVAVLYPASAEDIVKLVRFARRHGIKVACRGQGHSTYGQPQVDAGVVIETSTLDSVRGRAGGRQRRCGRDLADPPPGDTDQGLDASDAH
jgi:hypothetical protein